MSRIEKFIVIALSVLSLSFLGHIIGSSKSQDAPVVAQAAPATAVAAQAAPAVTRPDSVQTDRQPVDTAPLASGPTHWWVLQKSKRRVFEFCNDQAKMSEVEVALSWSVPDKESGVSPAKVYKVYNDLFEFYRKFAGGHPDGDEDKRPRIEDGPEGVRVIVQGWETGAADSRSKMAIRFFRTLKECQIAAEPARLAEDRRRADVDRQKENAEKYR